jgi:hypothetical protein
VFTEDAQLFNPSMREGPLAGRENIVETIRDVMLRDVISIHQGFMPDITVVSETEAQAIWSMQDILLPQSGSAHAFTRLAGFGHYDDTYRRCQDGRWRISSHTLTRLHVEIFENQRDPQRLVGSLR